MFGKYKLRAEGEQIHIEGPGWYTQIEGWGVYVQIGAWATKNKLGSGPLARAGDQETQKRHISVYFKLVFQWSFKRSALLKKQLVIELIIIATQGKNENTVFAIMV